MANAHEQVVRKYVNKYYPKAGVVLLAGSAAKGKAIEGSDLDLVIFDESAEESIRRIDRKLGSIFEVFLVSPKQFPYFLEEARKSGIPSIVRMCAEGVVVVDHGQAAGWVARAREVWQAGPYARPLDELDRYRYEITEQLEDFAHSDCRAENLFVLNKIAELLGRFLLRANKRWLGVGKWAYRALEEFNPAVARQFAEAMDCFYRNGSRSEFVEFVRAMLAPYGGKLRVGWIEGVRGDPDEAD
ncbi:MAG TPA: nucleotidyltransferase domain-containing protein [Paenibacillus sp.]|uniref:nucleotidyltransferase domain-containing protein n=1 Tax=Paenibacillus sp. TaxID=58172 RepID=UPI0028D77A87|nr:nucleotidyltransferase domain-containing protein [Paenibacillus sp.]HUC92748.1 nucleotidyltransferase domain-containing protein [Paenibacillus sp.]